MGRRHDDIGVSLCVCVLLTYDLCTGAHTRERECLSWRRGNNVDEFLSALQKTDGQATQRLCRASDNGNDLQQQHCVVYTR